jgi:hypothetical protein
MLAAELEALLRSHAFLRVERPPALWDVDAELEPFIRLLGEMIAAGLARNGQRLEEVTLNVSNVVVDSSTAGLLPEGDFVAVAIRAEGDWRPETTWRPEDAEADTFLSSDLEGAARAAGVACGYTRSLPNGEGSVTVFFRCGA